MFILILAAIFFKATKKYMKIQGHNAYSLFEYKKVKYRL